MFLMGMISERHGPIGIAIKLEDGNMTPVPLVAMKVLRDLELLTAAESVALDDFSALPLRNWRGLHVGHVAANFSLALPVSY